MTFPIKNYKYKIPDTCPGSFGYVRKHDIHTGIDLYCNENDSVYSITGGEIINIIEFTGFNESPWWNDTYAVLVYTEGIGTIVYGEILPDNSLKIGDFIEEGKILGKIIPVLKKDKGLNPINMLHIELYSNRCVDPIVWQLNTEKNKNLINPFNLLNNII